MCIVHPLGEGGHMPKRKALRAKTSKPARKPQTKTSFVLALPKDMPAKDVVAKGKAAGVALTDGFVYAIRSSAKRKAKGAGATRHGRIGNGHAVGSHTAEELLKAAAAELGLSRAMSILQTEHEKVHRLLGG